MTTLAPDKLEALIKKCLNDFYEKRFETLQKLKLRQVLKRKNPYLFKALGTELASEIVKKVLEAYISSSDETIFGNIYFEQIALNLPNITVSDAKGVDLILSMDKVIRAYALKSGPYPFNSSAKDKQNTEFLELKSRLMKMQSNLIQSSLMPMVEETNFQAVNGFTAKVLDKNFGKNLLGMMISILNSYD